MHRALSKDPAQNCGCKYVEILGKTLQFLSDLNQAWKCVDKGLKKYIPAPCIFINSLNHSLMFKTGRISL